MLRRWQVTYFSLTPVIGLIILVIASAVSCTVPRKYQKDKPFVFKTTVELTSDLPSKQKQDLKDKLLNQLDDSLKIRTILSIRAKPPFFYNRLNTPAVFDTVYLSRSRTYMDALLHSQGYFSPVIRDTFRIDTVKDQKRVTVNFFVNPGKLLRYDSVGYSLSDSVLQQLALDSRNKSLIKKNDGYSLQNVAAELDRLLTVFRNNGYYKISKEDLYAEHDTVVAALIDPTLDPFEQIRLLDSLQKKRENPTIAITFKQRDSTPVSHLQTYQIGQVDVYPEMEVLQDSVRDFARSAIIDSFRFHYNTNRFKLPFIARNIKLKQGNLYRIDDYFRTINIFTNLGAWQQVSIDLNERSDSVHILDPVIRLYPAQKQSMNIDFEASRNVTDVLTIGSLFGVGLNLGLTNRNGFRESIQTSSNLRFGVELGKNFVQTFQTSFSHSIYIPRFILPFRFKNELNVINPRTVANFNLSYSDRRTLFDVRTINFSWGYEWGKRNHTFQYLPFNFEYTDLNPTTYFKQLQDSIPSLRNAFNNGLIISQVLAYNKLWLSRDNLTRKFFQARVEESGALFGLFNRLERGELRRFIKFDVEYKHFIERKQATWAFRIFTGLGIAYGKTGDQPEYNLPVFKSYFGGGPYSMRAWRVRKLGPGSNTYLDTLQDGLVDRYGDIKIEGNAEYRFNAGRVFGVKVQGALFTDIGNIWLRNDAGNPNLQGAVFKFANLYKDLAVAGGISARLDFDFFLIRFDWAYKLKDPIYSNLNSGWFHDIRLSDGQFQLGIGYPF